jgi:hypothetical protein
MQTRLKGRPKGTHMESQEISESIDKAREANQSRIGLTMAVIAVLLAIATMLGHRTHTEEVLIQSKANDQWAYYQAKTIRAHMYEADAEMLALLPHGEQKSEDFKKRAEDQRKGAEDVRKEAEAKERETDATSHRANQFDTAEIFLEITIVLCSITLLTRKKLFFLVSFASTIVGTAFAARGLLLR